MKPETLESLLVDRTLGELPPATAELLDAYLRHDAAAAASAENWRRTWQTAREAVRREETAAAALSPPEFLRGNRWRRRLAVPGGEWLRLAACLAVGIGLGWAIRAGGPARPVAISAPPVASSAPVLHVPAGRETGFWSVARLLAVRSTAAAANLAPARYRVRWDSPNPQRILEEKQ